MIIAEDEIELADYFRLIFSWKRFIIIGVLLCTGTAYVYLLTLPKIYSATAKILILKKPKFQLKSETKLITEDAEVGVNTQMNLLFSQEIAKRVLAVFAAKGVEKMKNVTPEEVLESGSTSQIAGTDLIELTVKNTDPQLAKEICFYWATEAIKYNDEIYSSENKDINNVVIRQYSDVKTVMADTQTKIVSFVTKNLRVSEEIINSKRKTLIKNTDKIDLIREEVEKFENELSLLLDITGNNTIVSVERHIAVLSNDLVQKKNNIDRLKNKLTELVKNSKNNGSNSSMFTVPYDDSDANSKTTYRAEKNNFIKSGFDSLTSQQPRNSEESNNSLKLESNNSLKSESDISITTNKDPMIFKTELSISALETVVANLELTISRLKKGLPELNMLFSKLKKVKWLGLNREELINSVTGFKLNLNSYIDFPGMNEADMLLNNILLYAQKKSFLVQLIKKNENINHELKEYTINNENFDLAIDKLKTDYSFLKSSHETLGKKLEENKFQSGMTPANIRIVEPPYRPTSPSFPNIKRVITITILASAFMFILLAFLLNALKNERIVK